MGLQRVIEIDNEQKRRYMSFKVIPSNGIVLCVYDPSGHNTSEQLAKGHFSEGLKNYMGNKSEGNENKIIYEDFNCAMDKTDRDGENKTQRLYRFGSNYILQNSLWIMGWRIYREGRTQIPLSSPTMIDPQTQDPGQTDSLDRLL